MINFVGLPPSELNVPLQFGELVTITYLQITKEL